MTVGKKTIHYGWVICFGCFVLSSLTTPLINALGSMFMRSVTEEFEISRSAFTLTSTLVAVCGMVLSPFWGKLFSKGNMRIILTVGLVFFGLAYMSYSLAQNKYHLYISSVCVGIAYSGCSFIPSSILITSWFKEKRGFAMSLSLSGVSIGGLILSPIVSKFLSIYGWRNTYQIIGLMVLIIAVPMAFLILRQSPEAMGLKPYGEGSASPAQNGNTKKSVNGEIDVSLSDAKKKTFFWMHLVAMFILGIVCSSPLRHINPYASDLHGAAFGASVVSAYSFVGIFGKLILGGLNDKFGTVKGSLFAFMMMSISFICLILGANPIMFFVMALFYGIGNGIGTVFAPLLTSATFGTKNFNIMRGITQSPMQLGMSLGGLFMATIYDATGTYNSGWVSCIILCILCALLFVWAYRDARKLYKTID